MRRLIPTALLVLAGTFLAMPRSSTAGTVLPMSLEQMTDRADMILMGRVVGQRAEWNANRTRIYTYVTLEVDHYFKGESSSTTTTIRMLGGQVGPFIAHLPGSPKFSVGEDVLLFCAGQQARIPAVLGLSLGKFSIATSASGEKMVTRDISTLMLANYNTASRRPSDPVQRYRLSELTSKIEGYLQ